MFVDVVTQDGVTRLEELPVSVRRHERPAIRAEVVAKANHIRHIANGAAGFFQRGEMSFHERVEQSFHLFRLGHKVHEEVVHAAEKRAPFEQIAANHDHQSPVAGAAQFQCPLPQCVPETRIAGMIPRAVRQRGPQNAAHFPVQIPEVRRIIVEIRKISLVIKRAGGRHMGDVEAVFHPRNKRSVGLPLGMKPRRVLRRLAVHQRRRLPVRIFGVERPANINGINSEAVQDEILRLGELLHHVINPRVSLLQTKMFLEIAVGDGGDAGTRRGSEIHRHLVRLTMSDGS